MTASAEAFRKAIAAYRTTYHLVFDTHIASMVRLTEAGRLNDVPAEDLAAAEELLERLKRAQECFK